MPARDYSPLGGIGGVQTNPPVPYSSRGNDKDRVQTFVFEDDITDPFIGTIHLQGSNDDPSYTVPDDELWVDLVELAFDGTVSPVGNIFLETNIEIARVRVECRTYTSGRIIHIRSMR